MNQPWGTLNWLDIKHFGLLTSLSIILLPITFVQSYVLKNIWLNLMSTLVFLAVTVTLATETFTKN
jgi:hypothetical protein